MARSLAAAELIRNPRRRDDSADQKNTNTRCYLPTRPALSFFASQQFPQLRTSHEDHLCAVNQLDTIKYRHSLKMYT